MAVALASSSEEDGSGSPKRRRSSFLRNDGSPRGLRCDEDSEHHFLTYDQWALETGKAPHVESLGFPLLLSSQARSCKAPVFHSWRVYLLLILIGVGTAMVAAFVDGGLEMLFEARMHINDLVVEGVADLGKWGLLLQYLAFCGVATALAAVAGILVCFFSPLAAGSGIPEIKCFLNGIVLPRVVSKVTLVAKAVGILFSVSAGLPVGKEGPMIHSGAVVAGLLFRANVGFRNAAQRDQPLSLNGEHRDIIAAGATAGVAAAFGAPMGACLFAIEEGTSHMNPRILMKLFVAATFSALGVRLGLAARRSKDQMSLGSRVPVFLGRFGKMEYEAWELPIFVLVGALGGLLGGVFCQLNKLLTQKRKVWMPAPQFGERGLIVQKRDWLRFLEVLIVTFCITSLHFWIPLGVNLLWGPAVPETLGAGAEGVLGHHNATELPRTLETLPRTERLFWSTGTAGLRSLLHDEPDFGAGLLLAFAVMHFFTTCWTYGLGVPSGLFVPSLLGGAAIGRLVGQALRLTGLDVAPPGIYALVGATAFLSGTARITISLAMIIMEVIGEAGFSLPIFITVMAARWIGNLFGRGIYDLHIIDLKHVPLLEHDPEDEMLKMRVSQVMAKDPVSFNEIELAGDIHRKLDNCTHNGFPVVRGGRIVGSILRDTMHYLLNNGGEHGLFADPPRLVPWQPMQSKLSVLRPALKPLDGATAGKLLDLRPYISKDFHVMAESACLFGVYDVFRKLGLRHLFVTSEETGLLCGVVTRKNLILMEGEEEGELSNACVEHSDEESQDTDSDGDSTEPTLRMRTRTPTPKVSDADQEKGFGGLA